MKKIKNQFLNDIEDVEKFIKIEEHDVKSILCKSKIPFCDYCINPYVGCSHGCVYCYAKFMGEYSKHHEKYKWGSFVSVKSNAPLLINSRIFSKKKVVRIILGSVTDAYQPIEKKFCITRRILQQLLRFKNSVSLSIVTKSKLIIRDIPILKKFPNLVVRVSLCFDSSSRTQKICEPGASSVEDRMKTLRILNESGINCEVFLMPIFPYITDYKKIISLTKDFVKKYNFDRLNLYSYVKDEVYRFVSEVNNELIPVYDNIFLSNDCYGSNYWATLSLEISEFCKKNNVNYRIFFDPLNGVNYQKKKKPKKEKGNKKRKLNLITNYFKKNDSIVNPAKKRKI